MQSFSIRDDKYRYQGDSYLTLRILLSEDDDGEEHLGGGYGWLKKEVLKIFETVDPQHFDIINDPPKVKSIPCDRCDGSGKIKCPECDGDGIVVFHSSYDDSYSYRCECQTCGGDKEYTQDCPVCDGEGVEVENVLLNSFKLRGRIYKRIIELGDVVLYSPKDPNLLWTMFTFDGGDGVCGGMKT